jgi:GTP pyrophosphokinase
MRRTCSRSRRSCSSTAAPRTRPSRRHCTTPSRPGGPSTLDRIWSQFGPRRRAPSSSRSPDADSTPKPPWRERKERYIARLATAPDAALLVDLACKVHNARIIVQELRRQGAKAWERTGGGRDGSRWYYRALLDAMKGRTNEALVAELEMLVKEMEA